MTIPVSQIVSVNPGVLAAAGASLDLNGLILSTDIGVPIGSVRSFSDADDVGAFYGLSSPEYQMALIYFQAPNNATRTPGQLFFAQYNSAAVGAYERGASLSDMSLTQLQAVSGTMTVNVGGVANTSASISLTSATSFSNAATLILAAFTSPNFGVTYDAQRKAFLITSTATGTAATITDSSGVVATSLKLTLATGATLSQGAAIATPATAMSVIATANQQWSAFTTTFEPATADAIAFSQWTSLQKNRYIYAGWDLDPNAKIQGNTTTWMYAVEQAQMGGTIPVFGNASHAAFILSWAASLNFTLTNGRFTLAFKGQDGLVPSVGNASDATALIANGYNIYGDYATASQGFNFMYPGSVSGEFVWADTYANQIKLNADLQQSMINLLVSAGSIPYNTAGNAMIDAAIKDPVLAAVNFGSIRAGITLSQSQIQQLYNAVGSDISQVLASNGYYLQIGVSTAAIRVARASPPLTLYYTDGGSVQKLTLGSIEIQ